MGQHRALATASGAGRVKDRREVVGRARYGLEVGGRRGDLLDESTIMRRTEALHGGEAEFSGQRANRLQRIGPADGQRRLGVTEKILKLCERIRRIERQQRGAARRHASRSTMTSVDLSTWTATRPPGSTPSATSALAARPERSKRAP